jgi:hypothetical protein
MQKSLLAILLVLSLGLLVSPVELFAREKKAYNVQVFFDRGLDGKTDDQKNQLNQVGDKLEAYVLEIFADNGVTATKIPSRDKFEPAEGRFLMTVVMKNYNPGSKAARIIVGMGAGATSLDLHCELFGAAKDPLWAKDLGRGSSRDWTYLCRTLGKDIFKEVDAVVSSKKEPAK